MAEYTIRNPITGESAYTIEDPAPAELDKIYSQAGDAAERVRAMPVKQRVEYAVRISDWILDHYDEIIDRLVAETGKARFDAYTAEIFAVLDLIAYYKGTTKKILKDKKVHTPIFMMGKKSVIVHEPLGVILVITPWNYPFFQGIVPSLLAFLAGNAAIVKPSEITPLKGLWEKMLKDTEFPEHAIQFVYGGRETGSGLIDRRPGKIHFTGSVRAGKAIMEHASKQLIPVDLELGGKDPAIVFDDVNIERTVNGVMWGAFTTSGQSCTSIERLYVQDTIYDEFVKTLVDRTGKLRTSNPHRDTDQPDECDVGAITSPAQISIIEAHIREAEDRGARLLCGGISEAGSAHMVPTIVDHVDHTMKIASEETFGPVLAVMKFSSEEEAVKLANDSPYGLSASVWSKDLKRANRVARALVTGNVSINNHMITEANAALPFGGIKDSGFGRYKGDEGLTTFCNSKSIVVDKQGSNIDTHWYPFTKTKWDILTRLSESYFRRSKNWVKFAVNGMKADAIGKKEKLR